MKLDGTGRQLRLPFAWSMDSPQTISVAMCTYEGAEYLPEQLESISAQTRLPDELVICDDHSSDKTAEILKQFAATAAFPVRLAINDTNLGTSKNFEKAISLCQSDIIALSDQDDVWLSNKLKDLGEAFNSKPGIGMVFTDAKLVDERLRPLGYNLWDFYFDHREQKLVGEGKAVSALLANNFVTGATLAFLSKLRNVILPIPVDRRLLHDGWIALICAAMGELFFLSEPSILYRQHKKQQTGLGFHDGRRAVQVYNDDRSRSEILDKMAEDYLRDFKRLEPHLARVISYCVDHRNAAAIARIGSGISYQYGRIAHYKNRARITSTQKLNRIPSISKELLNFGYHSYSKGLLSAARDLVL